MGKPTARDSVLRAVDAARDEIVALTQDLIRIPTVNPPGDAYEDCAQFLGDTLRRMGFAIEYYTATGRPEHTATHPRVNVVGRKRGLLDRPCVHLNGHIDVVPVGEGWTRDPFGAEIIGERLYGRGEGFLGPQAAVRAGGCPPAPPGRARSPGRRPRHEAG